MEGPELLSFDHVLNEHIKNFSFFYFEKNMGPLKVLSDTKLIQNKSKKNIYHKFDNIQNFQKSPFLQTLYISLHLFFQVWGHSITKWTS